MTDVLHRPMFPLERALVPYDQLALHIFEPRYRAMVVDCMAGEREFGVVLIERGREVGGGEARFVVGTLAHVAKAVELDDGRYLLGAVGIQRLRVEHWLDDDPYPRAEITMLTDTEPGPEFEFLHRRVTQLLRGVFALRTELGFSAPSATLDLAAEPVVAAYQATILAGLGPIDVQRVLESDGPSERLELIAALLDEERDALTRQIAQG